MKNTKENKEIKFIKREKTDFNDRTTLDVLFLDKNDEVPMEFDKFRDKSYLSFIKQGKPKPRSTDVYKKNEIYGEKFGGYVTKMISGTRKTSKVSTTFIEIYNKMHRCLIRGIKNNGSKKDNPIPDSGLKLFKRIISLKNFYKHYDYIEEIIRISKLKHKGEQFEIVYKDNYGRIRTTLFDENKNDLTLSNTATIFEYKGDWDYDVRKFDVNDIGQAYFYVLKISNNIDTFYKFGITIDPERRYKGEKITEVASKLGYYVETVLLMNGGKRDIKEFEKVCKQYFKSQNRLKDGGIELLTKTNGDTEMVKDTIALELESLYDSEDCKFDIMKSKCDIFKRIRENVPETGLSDVMENQLNKDYTQEFAEF